MITNKHKLVGLGLIEALATFLIIVGSVTAIAHFQNKLSYSEHLNQQQNVAMTLASDKIETLRDFINLTGSNSYQSLASGSSTASFSGTSYTTTWTITTATNPDYKTIDVSISWTDRKNSNQSLRLVTRVAGIDPAYSAVIME